MKNEIDSYITGSVEISKGYRYSAYNTLNRISLFLNNWYEGGKINYNDEYLYYFDIIHPCINSRIKNLDYDTREIRLEPTVLDSTGYVAALLGNSQLENFLRDNGIAKKLNDAVEYGSSWGNVIFKKTADGWIIKDLLNTYVLNQTAETLNDSPVIERAIFTSKQLRDKREIWKDVDEALNTCWSKDLANTQDSANDQKSIRQYEIWERNGEISELELRETQGKDGGDDDKYVFAKIISIGEDGGKKVLYAEQLDGDMGDIYKEYHEECFEGRWLRKGAVEILFDPQTRINTIGNEIAQGLRWASKTIFVSDDNDFVNNIMDDMENGEILRGKDVKQLETRMNGFDQLANDWNRQIELANQLTNNYEVVRGETPPSGTPFRTTGTVNQNANKYFDFLREKLGLTFEDIFNDWIMPDLMKDLKAKDTFAIGGSEYLKKYNQILIDAWFNKNLLAFGPMNEEEIAILKAKKMEELSEEQKKNDGKSIITTSKEFFKYIKLRARVVIHGESSNKTTKLENLANFIPYEADPIRRSAILDEAMKISGIDTDKFPKPNQPNQQPNVQQSQGIAERGSIQGTGGVSNKGSGTVA